MRVNKNFQKSIIRRSIKRRGYSPELFDLDAYVDSKLSTRENLNIINMRFGLNTPTSGLKSSGDRVVKAEELHSSRSSRSKREDNRRAAKNTFDPYTLSDKEFKKWRKNPNRFDILGID